MYIRLLEGPNAGEIRDVENGTAIELMNMKRAENPYLDAPPPVIAAKPVEVVKPAKHGKKAAR
jgi:hypothetical protein